MTCGNSILYLMQKKKPILYKICLGLTPLPILIRIFELQLLPQEGSTEYYIFTGLFYLIWLVIGFSIISLLSLYFKAAIKSAGDVKKRSWAIVISILIWLVITFLRQIILKTFEKSPALFWVPATIELLMLLLFIYGFAQTMEFEVSSEDNVYLYQNWFFNVIVWGTLIMFSLYLSIIFWNSDLESVIYWKAQALTNENFAAFGQFIDQSVVEGDGLGGQDISYFLLIPFVLLYFPSYLPAFKEKLEKIRIYGGLMIANAVVLAIVNRGFKAFFSRARPGAAIEDGSLYSKMWMMGKWSLEKGFSTGSFTSGHTTTGAIVIILAFIAIRTHKTWFISLMFAVTITWTGLMGFGRVVGGKHYPSDTIWATTIALMLTAWVYFKVLRIPEQERGEFQVAMKYGEFRWGILFVFFAAFILGSLLGIKYTIMEFEWYWLVAAIAGLPLAFLVHKRMDVVLYGKEFAADN